jgi:TM2 domain-containing membrane protein YozV
MTQETTTAGQGSTGNVLAAICSFFIPGLGQLVQGRMLAAAVHFVLCAALWFFTLGYLGWIGNILSCWSAAKFRRA